MPRPLRSLFAALLAWGVASAAADEPKAGSPPADGKKPAARAVPAKKAFQRPVDTRVAEELRRRWILRQHAEADLDKDGKISLEEEVAFETRRIERFLKGQPDLRKEVDANKDGKIGLDEIRKFRQASQAFRMEEAVDDLLEKQPELKDKIDANHDGKVSQEEWTAYVRSQSKRAPVDPRGLRPGQKAAGAKATGGGQPAPAEESATEKNSTEKSPQKSTEKE